MVYVLMVYDEAGRRIAIKKFNNPLAMFKAGKKEQDKGNTPKYFKEIKKEAARND